MMRSAAILATMVGLVCECPGQFAPFVPTDFVNDTLTTQLSRPRALAILPDGRLLIAEVGSNTDGTIKIWAGSGVFVVGVIQGVDHNNTDSGVNGIAVDPQWPVRPYVYVLFDSSNTTLQLSMFTMSGDLSNPSSVNLSLGQRYDILTNHSPRPSVVGGTGCLRFGQDGMLYVPYQSSGTAAGACAAQDISSAHGCILRLDVSSLPLSGSGPPAQSSLIPVGNPFSGPDDNARLVWAYGLRFPLSFDVDPVTSSLYVVDKSTFLEEVNEVTAGGNNFGYPWFNAFAAGPGCPLGSAPPSTGPIHFWPIVNSFAGVSVALYRNVPGGAYSFGPAYEGDYFFADSWQGFVRRLKRVGASWVVAPSVPGQPLTEWGTGFNYISDAIQGLDGAIYYVCDNSGSGFGCLGRIRGGATTLQVISGNLQAGTAGQPLAVPLVVRLTTAGGVPVAGAQVAFAPNNGLANPATTTTDAQGYASTTYTLSPSYLGGPQVTVSSQGAPNVTFFAIWRGLSANYAPAASFFSIEVRHSQLNSPFTLCWETPPASAPYGWTPFGALWTSVLAPVATLGYVDGLGLLGPPNPSAKTLPWLPTWSLTISPLPPLGGIPVLFQAYAVDTSLLPGPSAFMISNPLTLTFN